MKKIISLLMLLSVLCALTACTDRNAPTQTENTDPGPVVLPETDTNAMRSFLHIGDKFAFTMLVPEEWSCDEMCGHIESAYFYPTDGDAGFTVNYSNEIFAVCGTGLVEREMKLDDGGTAYVGYYDGSENWSYVSFRAQDEYCSVINNGLTGETALEALAAIKTMKLYYDEQLCTSEAENPVTIDPRFAEVLHDTQSETDSFYVSVYITLPDGRSLDRELSWLDSCGYPLVETDGALVGELTAAQILSFPVYGGCRYEIRWNGVNELQAVPAAETE